MDICAQKILVSGLVQGIGFRPYIAELAEELQLTGQVKNLGGVVEIIIQGNKQAVDTFIHRLNLVSETGELPGCRIDSLQVSEVPEAYCVSAKVGPSVAMESMFHIVESDSARELRRFLPVDLPTCDRCIAEMHDPKNRRYRYPFISCTSCGPRFSIQKAVPYDRETITMDAFPMCEACYGEYTQKGNIRRHAQTIACKDCGPRLRYVTTKDSIPENVKKTHIWEEADEQQAIAYAVQDLKNGKIGAIKDIGGFHFAFSPMCSDAAVRLREFKNRDKKPFAVMFPDVDSIREYCEVSKAEEELLLSSARPIVLLKKKKDFVPEICGESDRIGALLPCNPLQILLLEETGPLVMTSGNRGGEPIIISEDEMQQHLYEGGVDFMLTHDREILTPLDDSIYQVTEVTLNGVSQPQVQLLRRARGLAPEPILLSRSLAEDTFAAGGDLKASFALGRDELVYMSQYFGDLEDVRCFESRQRGRERMEYLLDVHPKHLVADMHPAYVSGIEVQQLAARMRGTDAQQANEEQDVYLSVQHHHAHVASVIAEHQLAGKVLGIACDGTGYGTDGTIWGSELLLCEADEMKRVAHLSPVKLLGGDASAKQADMTLFSYMLEAKERGYDVDEFLEQSANTSKKLQEMAWKQNINTVYSSSMGRLFDATAALLDICHYNSYEGECAILLEQMAHKGKAMLGSEQNAHISKEKCKNILQPEYDKIDGILQANGVKLLVDTQNLKGQYHKEILAYAFHLAVAQILTDMAVSVCQEMDVQQVALSGGTFLNRILLQEVLSGLREAGLEAYINEKIPCGDGGIALGQMYLATYQKET